MRRREKVDLPLLAGPQTRTTGGEGSEEMEAAAEAQSAGTKTSGAGAGSGAGEPGVFGLGLGMGGAAWAAGGGGGGDGSGCFFVDRRRFRIAAPLVVDGTEGLGREGSSARRRGDGEWWWAAVGCENQAGSAGVKKNWGAWLQPITGLEKRLYQCEPTGQQGPIPLPAGPTSTWPCGRFS
jgi:hypothetical protein